MVFYQSTVSTRSYMYILVNNLFQINTQIRKKKKNYPLSKFHENRWKNIFQFKVSFGCGRE
jgi:hypothetical protein